MRCDDVTDRLLAYIDGALPEHQALPIARHLEGCASCQQEHSIEVEMAAALDMSSENMAGDALMAAVMADIEPLPTHEQPAQVLHISPFARWALTPLLAAAAFALLVWFTGVDGGGAELVAQMAGAQDNARVFGGDLTSLALGVGQSAELAAKGSHGLVAQSSARLGSLIGLGTAMAALACAALVARFRHVTKERGA